MDNRSKLLVASIHKLYSRGALDNIRRIIEKSHHADVAEIIHDFKSDEAIKLFAMVPTIEDKANILSYLEQDYQKKILQPMTRDEKLQLVSLMESDDAADLLGDLPKDEASEILSGMGKEDSEEVSDLMGYPEDSAGGLMSSEYWGFNESLTVADVIRGIQSDEDDGTGFYVYVVNDHEQLVGVMSLKQLLLSKRTQHLKDLMYVDVIAVKVDTSQEQVAKIVEKYDFLSVPVVDKNNQLVGVITVDDVIDVIREEAEEGLLAIGQAGGTLEMTFMEQLQARLPWLCLAFLGGAACFATIYYFCLNQQGSLEQNILWIVAAFIPVLLSVGGTTGSQSTTVTVGVVRSGRFDVNKAMSHFIKELKLGAVLAVLFGGAVLILGAVFFPQFQAMSSVMSLAMSLQILIAVFLGNLFPVLLQRLGMDPSLGSIPLFAAVADFIAILILFGLFYAH